MNAKIIYTVLIATVFGSACVSAGIFERKLTPTGTQEKDVVQLSSRSFNALDVNVLLKYSVMAVAASGNPTADIWENILSYLNVRDIRGLWLYLSSIPEMQAALGWLEVHYPDVFLSICWLFDSCGAHDTVIDPKVIQKILQLIQKNDWDGLVAYLETLDDFELLVDWIKTNFPDAWKNICNLIDRPC